MRIHTAIAALLLVAATGAASAADLPRKAPAYYAPAAYNWSGFYVGLNAGYGFGKSNYDFGAAGGGNTGDFSVNGAVVGGTLGYNFQSGNIVYGLEGDFDYSMIKGSDTALCVAPGCETRNNWLATGRARIGYAWDRWMPFITGGAALGSLKFSPATNPTETKTKLGWTIGAGVEYALFSAWTAKLEYLYVDLGNTTCSAASCGVEAQVGFKTNLVRAGLNYRF